MEYEKVFDYALARYESVLQYSNERLRKEIDLLSFDWLYFANLKYRDLHYAFGFASMLRLVFPDMIVKNDIFGMRLEHLYDHSFACLRDYFSSVRGCSTPAEV